MKDTLEKLKKELEELKESNAAAWDMWGSELCAGDMERKEKELEDLIYELEHPTPLTKKARDEFDELWNLMPTSEYFKKNKELKSIQLLTEKDSPPVMIIKKNMRRYKYRGYDEIINALKELNTHE